MGESGVRKLGIQRNAKVSEVVTGNMWNFRRCRDPLISQILRDISSIPPPESDSGHDQILWKHGELDFRPLFSSKKTWLQIRAHRPAVNWSKVIWFHQCIPRQAFIVWLAIKDRLATGERTRKWGQLQSCVLCGERDESRDHLFFACPYSFTVWGSVSKNLGSRSNPDWEITLNSLAQYRGTTCNYILLRLAFHASIYHIWRERNNRRHQKRQRSTHELTTTIQKEIHHKLISISSDTATLTTRWLEASRTSII